MLLKTSEHTLEDIIAHTVSCLCNGGVVLLPTDTVYGLAVHPKHPESIKKLYQIKDRPKEKLLPLMVHHPDELHHYQLEIPSCIPHFMKNGFIPGPLTFVAEFNKPNKPDWLVDYQNVAIRIPNDPLLLEVLKQTGPLFVTSANRSGLETPEEATAAMNQLCALPDLVVCDNKRMVIPSTIIRMEGKEIIVLREGAISKSELLY